MLIESYLNENSRSGSWPFTAEDYIDLWNSDVRQIENEYRMTMIGVRRCDYINVHFSIGDRLFLNDKHFATAISPEES